jgi:hypothetical protein
VPVTAELFTPGSPWFLEHSYYWSYAASWVVLAVEVLAVGLAEAFVVLFLISLVFPSLRPLNILIRTSSASGFVAFLFCIVLMYAHAPAADYIARVVGGAAIRSLVVIGIVFFVLVCAGFLVALWPANLLRDVVHYLGTSAGGARLADQQAIHDRLQRLIDALRGSPALNRIVLVCHSLGTVVVADFLLAAGRDRGRRVTVDLITAGSPVRRLINFLLPNRLPGPLEIRARLNAGTLPVERWFNAYRIADYVGTRLVPFRTDCSDPYTGIRECPLQPRWNWPWGHANYWADPRFVRLLAAEVLAPVIRADRRGFSSEVS